MAPAIQPLEFRHPADGGTRYPVGRVPFGRGLRARAGAVGAAVVVAAVRARTGRFRVTLYLLSYFLRGLPASLLLRLLLCTFLSGLLLTCFILQILLPRLVEAQDDVPHFIRPIWQLILPVRPHLDQLAQLPNPLGRTRALT